MALLEARGMSKSFGALTVVDQLDLHVDGGEVLGVIGPNGAGKTTALALIAGELPMSAGSVHLDGTDISRMPVHRRCRAGIGRTFQVPRPFVALTVLENVLVGALHGRPRAADGAASPEQAAVEALAAVRLLDRADAPAGSLTLLERKRLELARALVTRPRLVLLDESAGGLTDAEVDELLPTIEALKADGVAIVWIEHVLHALTAVADRVICIDRGRLLAQGTPDEVLSSTAVQDVYLGAMV
jgi:branched-chain amino acid transport system ATP-binding protein